jgi:hypothetical protein
MGLTIMSHEKVSGEYQEAKEGHLKMEVLLAVIGRGP